MLISTHATFPLIFGKVRLFWRYSVMLNSRLHNQINKLGSLNNKLGQHKQREGKKEGKKKELKEERIKGNYRR